MTKIPDPKCELCGGTGEVDAPVWDDDSHTYQPTGTQPCLCVQDDEDDYDPDGDIGGSSPIRPIYPTNPPNDGEGGGYALLADLGAVPSPLDVLPRPTKHTIKP